MKEAIVLTAALETAQISPTPAAERRGPAIVRSVGAARTPLDLRVIPFRYRKRDGGVEAIRPDCRRHRPVTR